jgi:hypothetical protein
LTIIHLKWSKGWISTVDQEEHVVLDLKLWVKVTSEEKGCLEHSELPKLESQSRSWSLAVREAQTVDLVQVISRVQSSGKKE